MAITLQDKIRGSLVGGAIGDALGYPVEFWSEEQIFRTYGPDGITSYALNPATGLAVISDDTQMTLFTANGILFGFYRQRNRGISGNPRHYVQAAYMGWLHTQFTGYSPDTRIPDDWTGWASFLLQDVPELYVRRAPGNTCLTALRSRLAPFSTGKHVHDFIADRINDSKGCGGIMRVAPLALAARFMDLPRLDQEGAQLAAITHSHPLGYTPAAALTHILARLIQADGPVNLKDIVLEARDQISRLYPEEPYRTELSLLIDTAIALSENDDTDLNNIHKLGEGWVAEEALAIPLYCCLRYPNDFSKAVIASVNHRGDSDSTGAITGNIMGALVGYDAIEPKWKESLELHDLTLKIADLLYQP